MKHATQAILTSLAIASLALGCGSMPVGKKNASESRSGGTSGSSSSRPTLNMSGAVALAIKGTSTSLNLATEPNVVASNNLMKVASDGSLSPAFTDYNPDIQVSKVWIVKNHVFLLFTKSFAMIPGEDKTSADTCWDGSATAATPQHCPTMPKCLLGYADVSDGVVKCVSPGLTQLADFSGGNSAIQFDDAGNLFYAGSVNQTTTNGSIIAYNKFKPSGIDKWDASTQTLKTITPFFQSQDASTVGLGFIVFNNGDVWQSGSITYASGQTVKSSASFDWAAKFPDGNTYGSLAVGGDAGRLLCQPMTALCNASIVKIDAGYNTTTVYKGLGGRYPMTSSSGKVMALNYRGGKPSVYKVFPEYKEYDLSVISKTIANATGNGNDILHANVDNIVVVAGTDTSGSYHLTSFDIDSEKETDLLPHNQIEIHSMASTATSIIFSGTTQGAGLDDGATGAVMGKIDLKTGQVSLKQGATTVTQIQTVQVIQSPRAAPAPAPAPIPAPAPTSK